MIVYVPPREDTRFRKVEFSSKICLSFEQSLTASELLPPHLYIVRHVLTVVLCKEKVFKSSFSYPQALVAAVGQAQLGAFAGQRCLHAERKADKAYSWSAPPTTFSMISGRTCCNVTSQSIVVNRKAGLLVPCLATTTITSSTLPVLVSMFLQVACTSYDEVHTRL